MNIMSIYLLQAPAGGGMSQLFFIGAIILVFYFFMIRPQMKKAKEQKLYRESLKKGDKIITMGGIHGKIIEISETTFVIETEGNGRLKIEKSAIGGEVAGTK